MLPLFYKELKKSPKKQKKKKIMLLLTVEPNKITPNKEAAGSPKCRYLSTSRTKSFSVWYYCCPWQPVQSQISYIGMIQSNKRQTQNWNIQRLYLFTPQMLQKLKQFTFTQHMLYRTGLRVAIFCSAVKWPSEPVCSLSCWSTASSKASFPDSAI
jgi:hypothetical protein